MTKRDFNLVTDERLAELIQQFSPLPPRPRGQDLVCLRHHDTYHALKELRALRNREAAHADER